MLVLFEPTWPARLTIPAIVGEATLVPPKTSHPLNPWHGVESNTETPVFGSASEEISGTLRVPPTPLTPTWYDGCGSNALGPPPLPLQPVSPAKPPPPLVATLVPPHATTEVEALG